MTDHAQFQFDVFLSHSSKDKAVVSAMAERLRKDGLRVWLDDWEIRPGDNIPAKIEEGLEHSRVLVLCMSANAFGSEWTQLEAGTFRFRDPLNKERRFIPLRLDDAPIKGSLAQFLYINWLLQEREQEYAKLLEACRAPAKPAEAEAQGVYEPVPEETFQLDYGKAIYSYAFSPDGKRALTGGNDRTVRLWDVEKGCCLSVLKGHTGTIYDVSWNADQRRTLSAGGNDNTVRLWDVQTGRCLRVLEGHVGAVYRVSWSPDQGSALSAAHDQTVRLWDVETGQCLRVFDDHTGLVFAVAWSPDGHRFLSGANDNTVRLWDVQTGRCLRVLKGHTKKIAGVAWSADQGRALSGGDDFSVRLWDVETGRCLRVLQGHTGELWSLNWSGDQRLALSGGEDKSVRLWDVETGRCLRVLQGHADAIESMAWSVDQRRAFSGDRGGGIRVWDLSEFVRKERDSVVGGRHIEITVDDRIGVTDAVAVKIVPDQIQYTNAKVLLVGDTSAGKTGLLNRLAFDIYKETDSTVGAWATQWKLPLKIKAGVEREIWLWDFGGQADQRLIHQLYMDQTHLAALVFDPQKEDLFEKLAHCDRDLTRAAIQSFRKLLVAGRIDAGGLRSVSRAQVENFAKEHGFARYLETSAKENIGCAELKAAIIDLIDWDQIAERTTPALFKRLKEQIVRLKDEGRVLMRFNDLREALTLRLSGELFSDDELKTVISLLAGPGVVWELGFGSWILLQPELINSHAQAVIRSLREDEREIGCIAEERVLGGDLAFPQGKERLAVDDERIVLLAMHEILVDRGLCLRDADPEDRRPTMLIFPSYARRERPDLVEHPSVIVSYQFNGFLDDIYATLVVRLHHTEPFERDQLWRDAADFRTMTGRRLGVKLTRRADGLGDLEVYFDPEIPVEEMMIFSKYVHEHLLKKAKDVVRLRHYVCQSKYKGKPCNAQVNREVAMERLAEQGKKASIICVRCEKRVKLWDDLEARFADPQVQSRVRELEEQSRSVRDSESKERILVGEVISTVARAGQLCREFTVSDHGIDMEIEFKNDAGEATGRKVYLQLKSGDSYLHKRKRDGADIFDIKKERHVKYWMDQAFPVMLVIRNSKGEIRWMEVRDWLKNATDSGRKKVRQIVFEGERFDVMSVRRWRDKALHL